MLDELSLMALVAENYSFSGLLLGDWINWQSNFIDNSFIDLNFINNRFSFGWGMFNNCDCSSLFLPSHNPDKTENNAADNAECGD
jgi:hypothetical protein